jgi:hypothetical protein
MIIKTTMISKIFFSFIIIFLLATKLAPAQTTQDTITKYLCREWKTKNIKINGKVEELTESQKGSRLRFEKDGSCESETYGEVQKKTWHYNSKKKRIELKDRQYGVMLYITINDMKDDLMTVSFIADKKKITMEIVPVVSNQ